MTGPAYRWRPTETRQKRGYGPMHDRIRRELLREEPWCRECAKRGLQTKATHADHVVPLCLGGPTIRSNYQPLCTACSRSKSSREGALMRAARKRARAKLEAERGGR